MTKRRCARSRVSLPVATMCFRPETHLNATRIDISSFPPEYRHRMHWLMGRLNTEQVARDDVYALDYFLDKFIAWTGYQIADAPQLVPERPASDEKIAADLDRALGVVGKALRELEALRRLLSERAAASPAGNEGKRDGTAACASRGREDTAMARRSCDPKR